MEKTADIKNRVEWVDTFKFLGILAIYVGHFLELGGLSHKFIFAFAVELFFFASGLFALKHMERPLKCKVVDRCKGILLPYFFFSILTLIVVSIQGNYGVDQIRPMIKQIIMGIRNQTVAPTLWFLPCLFIVFLFYELLYIVLKNEWVLLGIGLLCYVLSAVFLKPVDNPRFFFNIDSGIYYFFFYALGAVFYKQVETKKIASMKYSKIIVCVVSLAILGISGYMYFGKMIDAYLILSEIPGFTLLYPLLISVVLIGFQIMVAMVLCKIPLLGLIGKNTLFLCGNEYLVKIIVPEILGIFGVSVQLTNPLTVYLYAIGLIITAYYIFIPPQKKILENLTFWIEKNIII